jgi:hypothetical protein
MATPADQTSRLAWSNFTPRLDAQDGEACELLMQRRPEQASDA